VRSEDFVEVSGIAGLCDDRAYACALRATSGTRARLAFAIGLFLALAIHFAASARVIVSAMWKQKRSESPRISISSFATTSGLAREPATTTLAAQPA
jgi:hypothetical protein